MDAASMKPFCIEGATVVFVDERYIRLADLIDARAGQIIRCSALIDECVRVVGPTQHFEHLAGAISEDL